MSANIECEVDGQQQVVRFSVTRELVLTPTNFTMPFDTVEMLYLQVLGARIQARQAKQQRVLAKI